jgi:hypothetical protein
LVAFASLYFVYLITDGNLNLFQDTKFGMTFNSMLKHLLRGEFDVDAVAIGGEGFVHDGKTFSYFGIAPAFLRLPLLAFGDLGRVNITFLSCVVAVTVALGFKLASVVLISNRLPKSRLQIIAFVTLVVALLFGGAQIQFLKASIYQEVTGWAGAIAAAFSYFALRGLFTGRGYSPGLIASMATLAGIELLTRISTAVGLYVATGLLIATLAWPANGSLRHRSTTFARNLLCKRTRIALGILLTFAVMCGTVNYGRWGNPLVFADFHTHIFTVRFGYVWKYITYGDFNFERLWYGIIYYLFPIWPVIRPDGQFLFSEFETRVLAVVELPAGSFLLSDALLLVLGCIFVVKVRAVHQQHLLNLRAAFALLIGFCVPILLMMIAIVMTFRYRMEFYPFIEFSAFLGFYAVCARADQIPARRRNKLSAILVASAVLGIISSHLLLAIYKMSPPGDYHSYASMIARDGWVQFYERQVRHLFPSVSQ